MLPVVPSPSLPLRTSSASVQVSQATTILRGCRLAGFSRCHLEALDNVSRFVARPHFAAPRTCTFCCYLTICTTCSSTSMGNLQTHVPTWVPTWLPAFSRWWHLLLAHSTA
jgi:hypothetical protein